MTVCSAKMLPKDKCEYVRVCLAFRSLEIEDTERSERGSWEKEEKKHKEKRKYRGERDERMS